MKLYQKLYFLLVVIFLLNLTACGSEEFNSHDSNSLERMMRKMSVAEQVQFLQDFELLVYLHGGGEGEEHTGDGSYLLNGYSVEKIKNEAKIAQNYIREKNSEFIMAAIPQIEKEGRREACFYQNKFGLLSPPRRYLRPTDQCKIFSRENLEAMLNGSTRVDQSSNQKEKDENGLKSESQAVASKAALASEPSLGVAKKSGSESVDEISNPEPNTADDAANKSLNKKWQDKNGFVHYPDGSTSDGPVD